MFVSQEAHLGFAALAIRATSDFAAVLKHAGQAEQAATELVIAAEAGILVAFVAVSYVALALRRRSEFDKGRLQQL